ncbi:hypothetical protein GIB67_020874 [Kingdonia uniflora]|uniref:Uncharacterized protein n=1 Tax=Kingdonia uniflora TaxID=39325 RepID=A0A7J7M7C4_9MAGN|nr:hypothetical protein GIB67_020874 [Kingdonia uniflora]
MATSSSSSILLREGAFLDRSRLLLKRRAVVVVTLTSTKQTTRLVIASSDANHNHPQKKKSKLSSMIQDIEPLDVSLIQKDVPTDTVDAMKRTISGMLGLLPSDQFHVLTDALWDPLSKLLVSSMMTGYTLRNAEYRLCLETNTFHNPQDGTTLRGENEPKQEDVSCDNITIQGIGGEMTPEAKQYLLQLQYRLLSAKRELHEIKRKNAALQMQQFVGEEQNDLLDYLRSLQPEKVAELSEPTTPELQETIHSVIHGLLATLSPKMHSKAPPPSSENILSGTLNDVRNEQFEDCLENSTSIQFQPLVSVTRDYLARLLFWCMLLGHYLRGLEYRLELMELFALSANGKQTT